MKKLIVLADWVEDSLTCAEFKIAVDGYLKEEGFSDISFVSVTSSTAHLSYILNQIVLDVEKFGKPLDTVIFANVDPRLNEVGKPLIVRLISGLSIIGPNSGQTFSLVLKKIDEVFSYSGVIEEKSQFNSRDLYARLCAHLMDYQEDELELDQFNKDQIESVSGFYVGHIDNFGNIKTTITQSDLKGKWEINEMVEINLNGISKQARYVDGLFSGRPDELVIYPGSSGAFNNQFIEISVWKKFSGNDNRKTGAFEFNNPKAGDLIILK